MDTFLTVMLVFGLIFLTAVLVSILLAGVLIFVTLKEMYQSKSNERQIVSGAIMLLKGVEGVRRDINGPGKAG
jgi:uncharacterized membrane protein YqiK